MLSEDHTFVGAVLEGDALPGDIDDWIDDWHEGNDPRPLNEVLGFTIDEYALWVEQPSVLPFLIHSKKYQIRLHELVDMNEAHLLAARSSSYGNSEHLIDYLRRTGRID